MSEPRVVDRLGAAERNAVWRNGNGDLLQWDQDYGWMVKGTNEWIELGSDWVSGAPGWFTEELES